MPLSQIIWPSILTINFKKSHPIELLIDKNKPTSPITKEADDWKYIILLTLFFLTIAELFFYLFVSHFTFLTLLFTRRGLTIRRNLALFAFDFRSQFEEGINGHVHGKSRQDREGYRNRNKIRVTFPRISLK